MLRVIKMWTDEKQMLFEGVFHCK